MINLFMWILFGVLSGWIISLLTGYNLWRSIGVSVIGAVIGGMIMQTIKGDPLTTFSEASVAVSVIFALILLGTFNKFFSA